jgi:hypothetical protein
MRLSSFPLVSSPLLRDSYSPPTKQPVAQQPLQTPLAPYVAPDQRPPEALRKAFYARLATITKETNFLDASGAPVAVTPWQPLELKALEARLVALTADPAHGGKYTPGTIEEFAVAAWAEHCGVLTGPVVRESTGLAEFVEPSGQLWDVKSPPSPPADARWSFDATHQLVKLRHDFSQNNDVLLNLTLADPADSAAVLALIESEFTPAERARLRILVAR